MNYDETLRAGRLRLGKCVILPEGFSLWRFFFLKNFNLICEGWACIRVSFQEIRSGPRVSSPRCQVSNFERRRECCGFRPKSTTSAGFGIREVEGGGGGTLTNRGSNSSVGLFSGSDTCDVPFCHGLFDREISLQNRQGGQFLVKYI